MYLHDQMLESVVFLAVTDHGLATMAGTAFLMFHEEDGYYFPYLVTARHNVRKGEQYPGGLKARVNLRGENGSIMIDLNAPWYYPDSEADDVAVMPFFVSLSGFEVRGLNIEEWVEARWPLRIGSDIFAVGLFTRSTGKERNRPIVRSGCVAALTGVPLEDENTGQMYDAYLVELHSIGGLSGSPVYVFSGGGGMMRLLGLIRGHWPKRGTWFADYLEDDEAETLNTGIAIVTPIEKAVEIIRNDSELKKQRREAIRKAKKADAPVEDAALDDYNEAEFIADLTKATRRLDDESDQEPKGTSE